MRVMVTGAGGFVGSHLAEALTAKGHHVVALVRPGSRSRWLAETSIEIVDCGMGSPEAMRDALDGVEAVYHLAGVTKARSVRGYFEGNAGIAWNLAEAIRRYGEGVHTIVGISSQAAAGPHPGPPGLDENAVPRPVSHYGRAKLEAEGILSAFRDRVRVGIVRPPMVYGPRDLAFLPLYSGVRRGVFPIPGSRRTMMSIIHVSDLVRGIVLLGEGLAAGRVEGGSVYFLSGQAATWKEIAMAIGMGLNRRPLLLSIPLFAIGAVALVNGLLARLGLPTNHLVPDKYREAKQSGWVCSDAKARSELGYAPEMGLPEGMRSTITWCLEHGFL